MRIPDESVRLIHRVLGFRGGTLQITKDAAGQVTSVLIDGKPLNDNEWKKPQNKLDKA